MKRILLILCVLAVGCNGPKISQLELIKSEGFIGYSLANYNKGQPKQVDEPAVDVKEAVAEPEVVGAKLAPRKYLRMLSAKKDCVYCLKQEEIFKEHNWIVKTGVEETVEKPYHILREEIESMKDTDNPLWKKYNTKVVPFFQVVVKGKVVDTHEGMLTHEELAKIYEGADK